MFRRYWPLALIMSLWSIVPTAASSGPVRAVASPALPSAPAFALLDMMHRRRTLAEFQGRPIALFFFCGCTRCRMCASQWAEFQKQGILTPSSPASPAPVTLVVFGGDAGAAQTFVAQTGLVDHQTTVLLDPIQHITEDVYHSDKCPRVFVLDAGGRVRYTNNTDDALQSSPLLVASRSVDALRVCEAASIQRASPPVASSFSATTLEGRPVDLAAQPGWRVIYFWAASCPCVAACERYSLVPLAKKYQGKVSFFAVASDGWDLALPRKELLDQIASHHLPYPVLLDTTHDVAVSLHGQVTPQTFVLNPQGRVVFHGMPDDSRRFLAQPGPHGERVTHTYLSVALAQALAGLPVTNSPLQEAGCIVAW